MHYKRVRKTGTTEKHVQERRPLIDRFNEKYEVNLETGCWEWTGAKHRGYGVLGVNKKQVRAHRFSYQLHFGDIPDGLYVCHGCDNPGCVNPSHLWLGTSQDNTADKTAKGRAVRLVGLASPVAKLTADQVRAIRSSSLTYREIAARYGLHYMTVGRIKRRETYRDVD